MLNIRLFSKTWAAKWNVNQRPNSSGLYGSVNGKTRQTETAIHQLKTAQQTETGVLARFPHLCWVKPRCSIGLMYLPIPSPPKLHNNLGKETSPIEYRLDMHLILDFGFSERLATSPNISKCSVLVFGIVGLQYCLPTTAIEITFLPMFF